MEDNTMKSPCINSTLFNITEVLFRNNDTDAKCNSSLLWEGINMTAASNTSSVLSWPLRCLDFFNFYYLALIIFVGVVGNTLSFLVFTKTHLRLRSSSYYLAALAVADTGFLLTLFVVWLNDLGVDLFNRFGWCQFLVYVSSVCACLSVWLTVAFTLERLIAVQYPLQRPFMCTVRRAKTIIVALTLTALMCHTYSWFTAGIVHDEDRKPMCELLPDYYRLMKIVNLLDTFATLIIPLILIVVMNAMIARNLVMFSRTFKKPGNGRPSSNPCGFCISNRQIKTAKPSEGWERDSGQGSVSTPSIRSNSPSHHGAAGGNSAVVNAHTVLVMQGSTLLHSCQTESPAGGTTMGVTQEGNHDKLQYRTILSTRTQYSITKMLLLISTVFILLNLPSYVIRLHIFINDVVHGHHGSPSMWLLQQFFMLLYYTNFSINFLLYSTCGVTFRHCLWRLVRNKLDFVQKLSCVVARCRRRRAP